LFSSSLSPLSLLSPLSYKSDVYAFAVTMASMCMRNRPFVNMKVGHILREVAVGRLRPDLPSGCSPLLKSVMAACWQQDPLARPDFARLAVDLQDMLDGGGETMHDTGGEWGKWEESGGGGGAVANGAAGGDGVGGGGDGGGGGHNGNGGDGGGGGGDDGTVGPDSDTVRMGVGGENNTA
jgi:hypothetical protein